MTFRIAISKQSAMSDISFIVSASILPKLHSLPWVSIFALIWRTFIFSSPQNHIFSPLARFGSSLNIQVQEAILLSLCASFVFLWSCAPLVESKNLHK